MLDKNDMINLQVDTTLFPFIKENEKSLDNDIKKESQLYRVKVYKFLLMIRIILAAIIVIVMAVLEQYSISWVFVLFYLLIQAFNVVYFTKNKQPAYWLILLLAIVDVVYICMIIVNQQTDMGFGLLVLNLLLISSVLPFYSMLVFCLISFLFSSVAFFIHISGSHLFDEHFLMDLLAYYLRSKDKLLVLSFFILLFGLACIIHWIADWSFKSEIKARIRRTQLKRFVSVNRTIIEQLKTGIIIVDNNGLIVTLNSYAMDLLGIKKDQKIASIISLSKEINQRFLNWSKTGVSNSEPYSHNIQATELFVSFTRANSLVEGGETLITLERVEEVKTKNRKATLAALGRLTAGIAHEIRNPLSSINSATQLLEEDNSLNDQHKDLLNIIANNVKRTNHIIEDILGLFSQKKSNYKLVNLKNVLILFSKDFMSSNKNYQFKLKITTDVDRKIYCMFDANQLNQVFWNLAYNAIRYSEVEETHITIHYSVENNKVLVIDFYDNGKGVDDDKINKIFEPFYTSSNSGTGLGLYLTKEICSINQANITLLTKEKGVSGAHFRLTMPVYYTLGNSSLQKS